MVIQIRIALTIAVAFVVLSACQTPSTPRAPATALSMHELRLAEIGATISMPLRYELLDHSSDGSVDRFLIGSRTTVGGAVNQRDEMLITVYHPGTNAPLGIGTKPLAQVLSDSVDEDRTAKLTVDEAAMRKIDGLDAIVLRSEGPTPDGRSSGLAQRAYLVLRDGSVLSAIYQADVAAIGLTDQKLAFDSLVDQIHFD